MAQVLTEDGLMARVERLCAEIDITDQELAVLRRRNDQLLTELAAATSDADLAELDRRNHGLRKDFDACVARAVAIIDEVDELRAHQARLG